MPVSLRHCKEGDAKSLSEIGISTFYETWKYLSTEDNIQLFMQQTYNKAIILQHLKSSNNTYYAAEDDKMIGFVRLRTSHEIPEQIKNYRCIEIAQIYVDKEYHDKKIGATLMQQALKHALDGNYEIVWLGAWEDNLRAIKFYERFGFEAFGKHKFVFGNRIDEDILMKKKL